MDKRITQLIQWYEKRTHRERLWTLLLGVIAITFSWYFFIFFPLSLKKTHLQEQALDLKNQLVIYQNKIDILEVEGPKNFASRKLHAQELAAAHQQMATMKFESGSIEYNDELIHTIFTQMPAVKITELKDGDTIRTSSSSKDATAQNLEIFFQSDYFGTMAYLVTLEKLPWCLSWDTLEYKVTHYPEADITLQMHIVNT